jgi:uncharacterized protein (TIGR02466 family)
MPVQFMFPTPLYFCYDVIDSDENEKLIEESYKLKEKVPNGSTNWNCDIYATFKNNNLTHESQFKSIIEKINYHVKSFAMETFDSIYDYSANDAWLNFAEGKHYQEPHYHPSNIFSAVYYLQTPENCGHIYFNDPRGPDMNPPKNIQQYSNTSTDNWKFTPVSRSLIIFRSYLQHGITQGRNKKERISLALNYN